MISIKLNTEELFKVFKVFFSYNKKDSLIQITTSNSQVVFKSEFCKATFNCETKEKIKYCILLNTFETITKLKKAQQTGTTTIAFDKEEESGTLVINSIGLTLPFSFESCEDFETFEGTEDGCLYDNSFYTVISKIAAKQKDLNYFMFSGFGVLAVGEQQFSLFSRTVDSPPKEIPSKFSVNSTALNNVTKLAEFGFYLDGSLGQLKTDNVVVQLPEVKSKTTIDFNNWVGLESQLKPQVQQKFKITNTKQLEQLFSTTKRVDSYDLCKLSLLKNKIQIAFFLNKEECSKFEFTDLLMELPDSEVELIMQTKHLQSLLLMSNYDIYFEYAGHHMPLYSKTDLGIESYTMLSLIV